MKGLSALWHCPRAVGASLTLHSVNSACVSIASRCEIDHLLAVDEQLNVIVTSVFNRLTVTVL